VRAGGDGTENLGIAEEIAGSTRPLCPLLLHPTRHPLVRLSGGCLLELHELDLLPNSSRYSFTTLYAHGTYCAWLTRLMLLDLHRHSRLMHRETDPY
jgi:hypothetical protein